MSSPPNSQNGSGVLRSVEDAGSSPAVETGAVDPEPPKILDVLVTLAEALGEDFDVLELMAVLTERAVELLGVTAAGVLLDDVDSIRGLTVAAASSESSRLLDVFATELTSGPDVDCVRNSVVVSSPIIEADAARWPLFARAAVEAGFRAVHALPMRLRGEVVGTLTLLHHAPHVLNEQDRHLGQALADAASVGLLSRRSVRHAEMASEQLQHALGCRLVVEQAKGMLAQRSGLGPDEAFAVLRGHARHHNVPLSSVCSEVVSGVLDLTTAGQLTR